MRSRLFCFAACAAAMAAGTALAAPVLATDSTDAAGATTDATGSVAAGSAATVAPVPEAPLPGSLNILAPADPGGGWDGTARAMQTVLDPEIDGAVEVENIPGAGGTIGLADFAGRAGDGEQLMVMGSVMVGAIITNQSPVNLDEVTPVARLTTEYLAVVVPADSELETFDDLVTAFTDDPRSVSWAGGSAGGSDHQLVALIGASVGVDPADINYIAHAGGGEALASLLSGATTVGVSGVSEFRDQVEAGELRYLAISAEEPVEGIDAPTIIDSGVDVSLSNWRGVVAPGELSDDDRASLLYAVDEMVRSEGWVEELERNGWEDFYLSGDAFAEFLADDAEQTSEVLAEIGLA